MVNKEPYHNNYFVLWKKINYENVSNTTGLGAQGAAADDRYINK